MTNHGAHPSRTRLAIVFAGIVLVSIVGVILFLKAGKHGGALPGTTTPIPIDVGTPQSPAAAEYGINVALSEGNPQPQPLQIQPLATGEPLSSEEVQQILSRLPTLPPAPGEQTDFNLPQQVLPPPRPGEVVKESFPPVEVQPTPPVSASGPLKILRFAPEGEIPVAPFVSVTFSQPMVPVGTLSDLASSEVPVRIEPSLPGTWRWLGTQTLTFEYDSQLIDRLPKATGYRVTVPAGVKSATGGTLSEAVSWTFKTPPPKMVTSYPGASPQPLDPIFFIAFDQRIDPAAVLKFIHVTAAGEPVEVVAATQAEIEADEQVKQLAANSPEGRWLAFRAARPLPPETEIMVAAEPGTPSAEGPLTTSEVQSFTFSTYARLRVEEHGCAWYGQECRPLVPFFIRFNNPLDSSAFQDGMLRIQPEIPGVSASVYGNTIEIHGQTKGQTTYTVTLSGKLKDAFGQQLGKDERLVFRVGKAEPTLAGPQGNFLTLDPTVSRPLFSVYAVNYSKVHLKVYAVQPSDWPEFKNDLHQWQGAGATLQLPGRLVTDRSLRLDMPDDTLTQVDIDLHEFMSGTFGHLIVLIEPPAGAFESQEDKWKRQSQTIVAWIQITQIGLDVYTDHSEMVAWTTDLRNGAPLAGVTVQPGNGTAKFQTGADGTLRFAIPSGATYLVARRGADEAILPRSTYFWDNDAWTQIPPADTLRWYVFDDRQMYRPGEEVHVKGWLRRIGGKQNGDVQLVGADPRSVNYEIMDPQGNTFGNGQLDVNALGGFDFSFTVPQESNLGTANIHFIAQSGTPLDGMQYDHPFQVQEFRRPEFEVAARNETAGPYFAGGQATLAVQAKYYAGGGLPNADVTWQVTTSPGSYSPPNWPDFTFGSWRPWWFYEDYGYPGNGGDTQTQTYTGKTDASGTHYLKLDFNQQGDPAKDPQPQSVVAQATVQDVNRQAWSSSTTLLVHPADLYIGLRSVPYFVERGTPLKVDFIVTNLDGKPVGDRTVTITAGRLEWKIRGGNWTEEVVDVQTCSVRSQAQPATCSFETPIGGTYQIAALVADTQGRKNQSRITRWVSGGQQPPARTVEQEKLTLIPDKETYQPGDTAEILVRAPFTPAEGMLTVSRSGILYTQEFHMEGSSTTLQIPIEAKHIPNLNIQVDLVGAAPRTDDQGQVLPNAPQRPAYASGQLNLSIPPLQRTLAIQLAPGEKTLEPGGETTLRVVVKDANGQPVPDAELAVVAVDEAILALTDYEMQDPLAIFYADRPSDLSTVYSRASIILADPEAAARAARAADEQAAAATQAPAATEYPPMAGGAPEPQMPANAQAPINLRLDFNPLATFAPSVRTDASGEARIPIKLPDNLTRYRLMVVAVDNQGSRFGMGESNITARLPLMVRPSAPRFLNFGDKFELPVVLQNQTDLPLVVSVAARATNLELGNAGLRVTVPANDRVEVRFPASTVMAGAARVQVAAVAGSYADAQVIQLPVYTPATTEAFATYGVIDEGPAAQPVLYPSGVFPQFGGLEVSTSSTALQALTDAVLYLVQYPYECSEQLASRILAIASLRDVLTAFKADGMPSPGDMESTVNSDLMRLQAMQNYDGGFGYWRSGTESSPFNTVHVAHALARARQKGFDVPGDMQQNALNYLREIESHYPSWYSQQTRWTLSAYALYVRNLSGDRDARKAERLLNEAGIDNLPMEGIGWLWPVIDDTNQLETIRQYVNNHVVETAGAANFTTAYDDQTYLLLSSDRRTDAILLDALIGDNPQSDLIPKLVNGLLAHRTKGRWDNTQENVFVLLALDRYFNTYESQAPDFVARLWLGDTFAGSSEFRGRTTTISETSIPMTYVLSETAAGGGKQDVILSKEGPGRLYYRLGLKYAPTDLDLKPLNNGFVIQRRYEAVDDPGDVTQDADGTWRIKAGARVRVRISMAADNRHYHVALSDPLPAGLEIVNPELAVSQNAPQDSSNPQYRYGWWWTYTWYEHQNMHDDRAEAFTSLLWDGVYEYSYIARATTPGTFIVPPAKAEEMYSPEVFGRSGSDQVIVE